MARVYAGILGPLAMTIVICRGSLTSGGPEGTLTQAIVYLVLFAVLGAVLGRIAEATIDESVRAGLEQKLNLLAAETTNKEAPALDVS